MERLYLKHLAGLGYGAVEARFLKGTGQTRGRRQILKRSFPTAATEGNIIVHGCLKVFAAAGPELQGARLRQDVIDVVEGIGVDVALGLPAPANPRVSRC